MKTLLCGLLALAIGVVAAQAQDQKGDKKKGDKPAAVGALPPHPLDSAFEKANTEKAIREALLNNAHYNKAVAAALKAKKEQEARFKKQPNLADASPAQAARVKFLEVLMNEARGEKKPEK